MEPAKDVGALMSDFHNYVASDLQASLERMTESRDSWEAMAHRLAKIVYDAGCYTYPTYLAYKEMVASGDR